MATRLLPKFRSGYADPFGTGLIAAALPMPLLVIGPTQEIAFVNPAAEQFFDTGAGLLLKQNLSDLLAFDSPLFQLISQARERNSSAAERDVDVSTPRHGERIADVTVTPLPEPEGTLVVTLQERSLAQRMDRQLMARGAVRSMHGMAAVLAHEIKNPLAGIRGAAQLLEETLEPGEREMTRLIVDESDRIRGLIDRMESFGDTRGFARHPVNIHEVLDRVRKVAESGFARGISIVENFDPSLPPVLGDGDQLIQVFLNLVRNAADALPQSGGEIMLTTGYRPGVKFGAGAGGERISLPLEVTVRDNGSGVPADIMPHIFDPFVTTKVRGSGLGLALVAKIVGDHGGVVECDSVPRRTVFRILLPKAAGEAT
jgi:two-component system nitrogen regulation sensor histidine kinase GlnL